MNLRNVNAFLAIFWLTVAIATSIYGIMKVNELGFQQAKMHVFLPCVAWAFWLKAFLMKKKLDQRKEQPND